VAIEQGFKYEEPQQGVL